MAARRFGILLACLVAAAAIGAGAYALSPWPSVVLIRHAFDRDAQARNQALLRHVPAGVTEMRDQSYGRGRDAVLDVFVPGAPPSGPLLPAVVWIHGGGFIAGSRRDVTPYLKILAGKGIATVAVGYSTAPEARYPTPLLQVNEAMAFLAGHASRFRIDMTRVFLAGDSAGAQIAAQLAAAISDPSYAMKLGLSPAVAVAQVRGIALFCGVYDASRVSLDGEFGGFLRTALWSYFGTRRFLEDPRLDAFSVARHLTPSFPPTFLSVGNADPLEPQSILMEQALRQQGVPVDTLFFPRDHRPALGHEYQFDLDGEAGRHALDRLTAFLAARIQGAVEGTP